MKQTSAIPIRACLAVYFVFLMVFLGHTFFFTDIQDFVHAGKAAEERDYMSGWTLAEKHTHVAIGYSYAETGDGDFNARRIEADNRMYDEKRRFHGGGKLDG